MKFNAITRANAEQYRRHKFPPYRAEGEQEQDVFVDKEPRFEDGFQQGLELGHKEGLEQGHSQGVALGKTDGHRQGMAAGFDDGQQQGNELFTQALELLASAQQKVEQLSRHKLLAQQAIIADLVGQVSKRVIRAELTLNPTQVLTLVEEALLSLTDEVDKVRIFLNPDDKQRLADLGLDTVNGWKLEVDNDLAIGDCSIRSSQMEISVDTAERFNECMESVKQSIAHESGEADASQSSPEA